MGLDTSNASALYDVCNKDGESQVMWANQLDESDMDNDLFSIIPAYTLQDVMDALSRFVTDAEGNKYYLQIEMMNTEFDDWWVSYKSIGYDESPLEYFQAFHLIDAAVRMLVLCFKNKYVKKRKEQTNEKDNKTGSQSTQPSNRRRNRRIFPI